MNYVESWTATAEQTLSGEVEDILAIVADSWLRHHKPLHYLQHLKNNEETQPYFDVDLKVPSMLTIGRPLIDTFLIIFHEIFRLMDLKIVSVCHSCLSAWTHSLCEKASFHIVAEVNSGDKFQDRSNWKKMAEKMNQLIIDPLANSYFQNFLRDNLLSVGMQKEDIDSMLLINWFDYNVYHKNQKFRMIYCTKPAHGIRNCDTLQRIKLPLYGLPKNSIIACRTTDQVQVPLTTNVPVVVESRSPIERFAATGKLAWFKQMLQIEALSELWQKKAESYDDWLCVGMSLYYEVDHAKWDVRGLRSIAEEIAFSLWRDFSKRSRNYSSDHDQWNSASGLRKKWDDECSKANISRFAVIKQWISHSKKIGSLKPYESMYKEEIRIKNVSLEFESNDVYDGDVDVEVLQTIVPYTSSQYRLLQHCIYAARYWKAQLVTEDDFVKLAVVYRYQQAEESAFWKYFLSRNKRVKIYGNLESMYHPFDLDAALDLDLIIIREIAATFGILLGNEKTKYIRDCLFHGQQNRKTVLSAWYKYCNDIKTSCSEKELTETEQNIANHYCRMQFPKYFEDVNPYEKMYYYFCLVRQTKENNDLDFIFSVPYYRLWIYIHEVLTDAGFVEFKHSDFGIILLQFADFFKLEKEFHFFTMAITDVAAARMFYLLYPYLCFAPGTKRMFIYDCFSGRWVWDEKNDTILSFISKLSNFLDVPTVSDSLISFESDDEDDEEEEKKEDKKKQNILRNNYGENVKSRDNLFHALKSLPLLVSQTQWNFLSMRNSDFRMLLFPNGIYNGITGEFEPKIQLYIRFENKFRHFMLKPEILFYACVTDDFLCEPSDEDIRLLYEMEQRLFIEPHGEEVGRFHIEVLACAFMGEVSKRFVGNIGDSCTGKSTEKALLEAAGGSYVGTFSICDLAYNKYERREHAMQSSFAHHNYMCRLLLSSENTELPVNTELMKMHASGKEDLVTTREQYDRAQTVEINYLMFFYVNNMWTWNKTDEAVAARGLYFSWNKVFADPITDPTTQLQMDPTIKLWKYDVKRRQLYMFIFLKSYNEFRERGYQPLPTPDAVLADTSQNNIKIDTPEETFEQLMYHIELTGEPQNFVRSEELARVYQTLNLDQPPATITRRIRMFLASIGIPNIGIKYGKKKERGKSYNGFFGMRLRASIMSGEDDFYLTNVQQWKKLMRQNHGIIPETIQNELKICARVLFTRRCGTEIEKEMMEKYWPDRMSEICLLIPDENHYLFQPEKRARNDL